MALYDALIAKWPTLQATTIRGKLAEINATLVPGPNRDVRPGEVEAVLLLKQAYFPLLAFSQSAPTNDVTHDTALISAKSLFVMINSPNAPLFAMSDPTAFAEIKAMADAVLAQETAAPTSTGMTQAVHDALLALPVTQIAWWEANNMNAAICENMLKAAGLVTVEQLQAEGMQ